LEFDRIKKKLRRERTASVGVTPLNCTLCRYPNGIFATCKQGTFVLQRATKLAKELIAQNPSQDCLQTRATSGLVFVKQAAAADTAGGGSRCPQAGSGRKQAGLVTRQGAQQGAKMARNAKCASFVAMVLSRTPQAAGKHLLASRVCQSKPSCFQPGRQSAPPLF